MKRVLVAGATGYLGRHVVRELKDRGLFVRALARSRGKLGGLADLVDDVVEAEVTRPETLVEVCKDIDVVFSSVGITRQKDGLSFRDVDFLGNLKLLRAALDARVRKFVYVSVFNGSELRHLDIVDAHEAFVDVLEASGIESEVIRPTGYFSDMGEILEMARRGRVWLVGTGENRCNPIDGADLAVVCADAIEGYAGELDVGGPETLTWRDAAELAFAALDRPQRISRIPAGIMWWAVRMTRIFSRHQAELLAFFTTMATRDVVAPAVGTRTIGAHYSARAGERP